MYSSSRFLDLDRGPFGTIIPRPPPMGYTPAITWAREQAPFKISTLPRGQNPAEVVTKGLSLPLWEQVGSSWQKS